MHRFLLGDSSVHISMDTQTCTNDRKKKSHKFIYSQRDGNTVLILKSSLCWPSHRMGYLFHPHSSLKSSSLSSVPFHRQHNSSFPVSQHRREWTAWRWSNSMPRTRLPQLLEVLEFWLYMTLEWIFAQYLLSIKRNSYLGKFSAGWERERQAPKREAQMGPSSEACCAPQGSEVCSRRSEGAEELTLQCIFDVLDIVLDAWMRQLHPHIMKMNVAT